MVTLFKLSDFHMSETSCVTGNNKKLNILANHGIIAINIFYKTISITNYNRDVPFECLARRVAKPSYAVAIPGDTS